MRILKRITLALVIVHLPCTSAEGAHDVDLIDDTKSDPVQMSVAKTEEAANIGRMLDDLFATCGRYPMTKEGLKALVTKPPSLKCKAWGVLIKGTRKPYMNSTPKGWRYKSEDGSSYNLEASK